MEQLSDTCAFTNGPLTRGDWLSTIANHTYIANRKEGEMTMWLFDPALDKEPLPAERQSMDQTDVIVDAVLSDNFLSAMEPVVDGRDMLVLSDAKHRTNLKTMMKSVKHERGVLRDSGL